MCCPLASQRKRIAYFKEKLRMARKYGLTTKDLQEIEDEELLSSGKPEEPDYFEYMEEKEDSHDKEMHCDTILSKNIILKKTNI